MNTETAILTKRSDDTVTTTFPVAEKTNNYTLDVGDIGKKIDFNKASAVTLNLMAVASAGDGFESVIENVGEGDLSISPDGAETVNGETSLDLASGEAGFLICDGSAWRFLFFGDCWSKAVPKTKTSSFSVSGSQLGRLFLLDSATTATATLPNLGFFRNGGTVFFKNIGSADWTIEGDGSDTIDGAASATLKPDESLILVFEIGSTDWHSLGGSGSGSASGAANPNVLINGDFAVAQRGSTMTDVADDKYSLDRWYVLTQTASIDVNQQTDQEVGQPTNISLVQDQSAAQRIGAAQIVEGINCKALRGQSVTLSARVRTSTASTDVRYAILEWTGTEDSVTSDIVNDWTSLTYTTGNFFISSNLTVTAVGEFRTSGTADTWEDITALTGTLGSSFNNLIVFFWTEATAAQNVTLDLGVAKLEAGDTASPFVAGPYGDELALCQRYFVQLGTSAVSQSANANEVDVWITYPVVLRRIPTTSLSTGSPMVSQFSIGNSTGSSSVISAGHSIDTNGSAQRINGFTGLTSGNAGCVLGDYFAFDAEL